MTATTYPADGPVAKAPSTDSPVGRPWTLKQAFDFFLTKTTTQILILCVFAAWLGKAAVGAWTWWDLAVAGGIIAFWPVQEWLIHVFILHWKPRKVFGVTIDPLTARKHRAHHRDPWDLDLVSIPYQVLPFSIPALTLLWLGLMPTWGTGFMGLAFYFTMTLKYEWVHYLIHTPYKPKTRYYRTLWENHRLHHFKNEKFWYGVSMLEGDWLLRTAPGKGDVPSSKTARTLGVGDDLDERSTAPAS